MSRANRPDAGAEWMLRFQSGDDKAFENLVRQYQETVYAFLYRFRGREDGIEDMSQEVFLRVYRARASYRPDAKFSTWLYRIVCNLCINETRDRKEHLSLELSSGGEDGKPAKQWQDEKSGKPLDEMENEELSKVVRDSLEELPESQRAAILLYRYQDMSYREIGEALGVSEKAVKSLMARARERLKWKLLPYLREEVNG